LIKGRRKFNSKVAILVGKIFNIEPELWLFIEAKYELKTYEANTKLKLRKVNLKELVHDR